MTLFVTVLSLEGSITETVDGVTAKTTKAAVSTVIPVVGKILGDATDSVIGCAGIIKNSIGVVGIIVVAGICLNPIIKLSLHTFALQNKILGFTVLNEIALNMGQSFYNPTVNNKDNIFY